MDRLLEGVYQETALICLNHTVTFGWTFDQELENLSEVFIRIWAAHLKLNAPKCYLFQKKVMYLGHVENEGGVYTDPKKVAIMKT